MCRPIFFSLCVRAPAEAHDASGAQTPGSEQKKIYFFPIESLVPCITGEGLSQGYRENECVLRVKNPRHFGKIAKNYVIGKIKTFFKGLAVTDQGIGARAQVTYLHFSLIFPINFYQQNQCILAISQLTGNTIHFQKDNSIYFVIKINIFLKCN